MTDESGSESDDPWGLIFSKSVLFHELRNSMRAAVRDQIGSDQELDDIVQDALRIIVSRRPKASNPTAVACTIARRQAINHINRKQKRKEHPLESALDDQSVDHSASECDGSISEIEEITAAIKLCLQDEQLAEFFTRLEVDRGEMSKKDWFIFLQVASSTAFDRQSRIEARLAKCRKAGLFDHLLS